MYILLESIINFEIGTRVKINPDNPIIGDVAGYNKVKNANREGKVIKIYEELFMDYDGEQRSRRTGKMSVKWKNLNKGRIVNYKNLTIIE